MDGWLVKNFLSITEMEENPKEIIKRFEYNKFKMCLINKLT